MRKAGFGVELLFSLLLCTSIIGGAGAQAPAAKPRHPAPSPPAGQTQKGNEPAAANEAQESPNVNVREAPSTGWVSRCTSEARGSTVECAMEQSAVLANTGQLVTSVTVRVPSDSHQPLLMIQVPIGLYLPAGLYLQIDKNKPELLPLQTCDLKGCYAGTQISAELLASLKAGKQLAVIFKNMAKNDVTVKLTLDNFAETYKKIE